MNEAINQLANEKERTDNNIITQTAISNCVEKLIS